MAKDHDISRERVRQLEVRALEKVAQHIATATQKPVHMKNLLSGKSKSAKATMMPKVLVNT